MLPQQENAMSDILSERWSAIGSIVGKPSGMVLHVDPSGHLKGPDRDRVARAAAEIPAMWQVLNDLHELWLATALTPEQAAILDKVDNVIASIEGD